MSYDLQKNIYICTDNHFSPQEMLRKTIPTGIASLWLSDENVGYMPQRGVNINTEQKYREAVSLYAESRLSIKEICEKTNVGFVGFCNYLSKYYRELILKRHNLTGLENVRLRGKKGQTTAAHYKYKEAIAACDSQEYIEYNISQIARLFNVDCCSLAGQLRRHYPDIVPRREKERRRMGITVNLQYGVRKWCKEEYAQAVEMLQTSDMTVEEVAQACNVSYSGLREHLTAYCPHVILQREKKRTNAVGQKVKGMRNGNWRIHEPGGETVRRYEETLALYRTTAEDLEEIVQRTNVSLNGFRHYLRTWHPELVVQRRGYGEGVELAKTKRYKKSTAEKYAQAIERLKTTDLPTAKVAAEFGLNPEVFRMYLKEHHPELTAQRGMTKTSDGKLVSRRSQEKYAEALHLYQTTTETLKSITERLGLTYKSVGGFIRRNHPDAILQHKALVASLDESTEIDNLKHGKDEA